MEKKIWILFGYILKINGYFFYIMDTFLDTFFIFSTGNPGVSGGADGTTVTESFAVRDVSHGSSGSGGSGDGCSSGVVSAGLDCFWL